METYQERVLYLLKSHKAKLLRKKKHYVWRLSDGRKWVTPNTASDTAAWQNNYTDLRKALGYKAQEKTREDFEHQKKDPFVKKHTRSQDFLAELPDREVLPTPPPGPTKKERELLEQAKKKLADQAPAQEREVYDIGGRFPDILKRGAHRGAGGRTSRPYTFSAEVMARANSLMTLHGEEACKRYLDEVRSGHVVEPQITKKEEEMSMTIDTTLVRVNENGSYDSLLQRARQDLRTAQQQVSRYQLEVVRAQETINLLEQVVTVQSASAETLRGINPSMAIASNGSSNGHTSRGRKGHLTAAIKEIIGTSPVPMDKSTLVKELQKVKGDSNNKAAYQTVWSALKAGWLVEVNGVVSVYGLSPAE